MEKHTRLVPCEVRQAGERSLTFIFSTEEVARDGDILRVKGWDTANFERNPVVLWAHRPDLPPIGRVTALRKITRGNKRLEGDIEFAGLEQLHDMAEQVYLLARDGFLNTVSVGFMPRKRRELSTEDKQKLGLGPYGNEWIEQELFEVSIVPVPADTGAVKLSALPEETREAALAVRSALTEEEAEGWPALPEEPDMNERITDLEERLGDLEDHVRRIETRFHEPPPELEDDGAVRDQQPAADAPEVQPEDGWAGLAQPLLKGGCVK